MADYTLPSSSLSSISLPAGSYYVDRANFDASRCGFERRPLAEQWLVTRCAPHIESTSQQIHFYLQRFELTNFLPKGILKSRKEQLMIGFFNMRIAKPKTRPNSGTAVKRGWKFKRAGIC